MKIKIIFPLLINFLLIEAKIYCDETLKIEKVIHIKIYQFYIDN